MRSISKKVGSILENGVEPIDKGIHNFNNPNTETETLAAERAKICSSCPENVKEPVPFLRVTDKLIPELSKRMCNACGCTLSYKLRQSITVCEKWVK